MLRALSERLGADTQALGTGGTITGPIQDGASVLVQMSQTRKGKGRDAGPSHIMNFTLRMRAHTTRRARGLRAERQVRVVIATFVD